MSGTIVYLGGWLGAFLAALGFARLLIAGLDRAADYLARREREGWK